MIDGIDLNQISKSWYREQISFSPQEPRFIDGSLKDNLIGSKQVVESEFLRVLKEFVAISCIS